MPLSQQPTDYNAITKAELLAIAEGAGIGGVSGAMKKADIIAALQGAE